MQIIKVPSSEGNLGKNSGCENAPDRIIQKIEEFYANESGKEVKLDEFKIDEAKISKGNIDETNKNIYEKAKKVFNDKDFPVFLGGDHSITYSLFKAFSEKNKNSGLLIFDAHPDTEKGMKSISHEDFLRKLVEDKILKKENVILVGLRNWSIEEFRFLNENKIKVFNMKSIFEYGIKEFCDNIMEIAREFESLYLSLDIDVTDPGATPGTGYIEPGGLSSRELIYFIQRIGLLKNLKVADIAEVNPEKDINDMTSKLAAKIIVELSR